MATRTMNMHEIKAVILDMDGVVTQTAKLHARAWKQMFDEYLRRRAESGGESHESFDIEADYRTYVDGKPRYDGVRSFLQSRGIDLPEGGKDDDAAAETICGLGNRKNRLFHELLQRDGVELYEDTREQIANWRRGGRKVAVISSSRNCEAVLKAAGILELFDVKVDGNDIDRLQLKGKPEPDMFLHAARQSGVEPAAALIAEDALAGVAAGKAGGFALVVGVDRNGGADRLSQAGADLVVSDLRELQTAEYCPPGENCLERPSSAVQHVEWIAARLKNRHLALFLDYDGTLTPIVRRPEEAILSDDMRSLLRRLAARCTLAIVSGRDRRNAEGMVEVENLVYAGSHGFDIRGPGGLEMQNKEAQAALPDLDAAEAALDQRIEPIGGAHVERKKFAIAIHYREVADEDDVARVGQAVEEVRRAHPSLKMKGGKKIFELLPDVEWDKGRAVLWLRKALEVDRPDTLTLYIGDDVTDEDAFAALRRRGLGIGVLVGLPESETQATYMLLDCSEVERFLRSLLDMLGDIQPVSPS